MEATLKSQFLQSSLAVSLTSARVKFIFRSGHFDTGTDKSLDRSYVDFSIRYNTRIDSCQSRFRRPEEANTGRAPSTAILAH